MPEAAGGYSAGKETQTLVSLLALIPKNAASVLPLRFGFEMGDVGRLPGGAIEPVCVQGASEKPVGSCLDDAESGVM